MAMNKRDLNNKIDLREIVKRKRAGELDIHINSATEEVTINTDQVVIDGAYQRNLSMTWARKIARDFDPEMFGKPLVARRPDGKFAVIDGQHRVAALRILYPKQAVTFRADLDINADTVQRQAKAFNARNTNVRKTGTGDELRALIAEENPEALAYQHIIESLGYRTKWGGGKTKPGQVGPYVFKAVRKFCSTSWEEDLADALAVCSRAWGANGFALNSAFIVGVALMFRRYRHDPRFNAERLADKIRGKTPMALAADAKARAELDSTRHEYGTRTLLRHIYNQRLDPKNQLPEF